jgi:hypothetical protein
VLCATNTKSGARGRTDAIASQRGTGRGRQMVVTTRGNKPPPTVPGARRITDADRHRRRVLGSRNLGSFGMPWFNREVVPVWCCGLCIE